MTLTENQAPLGSNQAARPYHQAMLETDYTKQLRERLIEARRESEVPNTRLVDEIGKTPQAVSGWFKTGRVDKEHLPKIAEIYGVRLEWLMTGQGSRTTADTGPEISDDDLLRAWRRLDASLKTSVYAVVRACSGNASGSRKKTLDVTIETSLGSSPHRGQGSTPQNKKEKNRRLKRE